MKIGRKGGKEVSLELSFERLKRWTNSKCPWKSIPTSWGVIGESSLTNRSEGSESTCSKLHVKRASNDKLFSKKTGG